MNAELKREVLECLYQCRDDLRHPPQGDSVQRRINRIHEVMQKMEKTS